MDLLNAFRIYRQVAREQSFTRAAERLNLVPSAVSRQISTRRRPVAGEVERGGSTSGDWSGG